MKIKAKKLRKATKPILPPPDIFPDILHGSGYVTNCITGFSAIKCSPPSERVVILRTIEKLTDLL